MAVRRRFKPTERATFVPKAEVEWLNGSHWRPGVIVGPIETDDTGRQYVGLHNNGTTRSVHDGQYVWGRPGGVRLRDTPAAPATAGSAAPETTQAQRDIETNPDQPKLF